MDSEKFHYRATDAAFDARDFLIEQANGNVGIVFGASLHLAALVMSELLNSGELDPATVDISLAAIKATVQEMTELQMSSGLALAN